MIKLRNPPRKQNKKNKKTENRRKKKKKKSEDCPSDQQVHTPNSRHSRKKKIGESGGVESVKGLHFPELNVMNRQA